MRVISWRINICTERVIMFTWRWRHGFNICFVFVKTEPGTLTPNMMFPSLSNRTLDSMMSQHEKFWIQKSKYGRERTGFERREILLHLRSGRCPSHFTQRCHIISWSPPPCVHTEPSSRSERGVQPRRDDLCVFSRYFPGVLLLSKHEPADSS